MNFDIKELAREHIISVAHRGICGGNIPCNTIAAYEIALSSGADMIEIDISKTLDGKLVIFHPGMEKMHLCHEGKPIPQMTFEEVQKLRFVNLDNTPTEYGLCTLDEVFETFKGRCYINADKFWDHPKEISDAIRRHNIAEQVLVKSMPSKEVFDIMENYAPEIMFLPLLYNESKNSHEILMNSKVNYIGAELCFKDESCEICQDEYIQMLHRDGKLIWANSIVYDYRAVISAGHNDDVSLVGNPDNGWGWLVDKGFDIIQTDWCMQMIDYLKKAGKYYK